MRLNKDPESWRKVSPEAVSYASGANIANVLKMALDDIAAMASEIERLRRTSGEPPAWSKLETTR